jgi:DNA-binding beta-propeller fold protein YncE
MAMALAAAGAATAAPEVYIPLGAANKVQVIDAAMKRPTAVIEDISNAHGLAITPDRRYLVVGSFTEVAAGSEDAPPRPAAVSQAEHEKHHATPAASGAAPANKSVVSIVDTESLQVVRRIAVGGAVHHVAVSPDGRFAVTTHPGTGGISVIDLASGQARHIALAPAPYHVSSVPGSGTVLVSSRAEKRIWVVDQSTLALRGEIAIDGIGHQMAVIAR